MLACGSHPSADKTYAFPRLRARAEPVLQFNYKNLETMALARNVPLSAAREFNIFSSSSGDVIIDAIGFYQPKDEAMMLPVPQTVERINAKATALNREILSRSTSPPAAAAASQSPANAAPQAPAPHSASKSSKGRAGRVVGRAETD